MCTINPKHSAKFLIAVYTAFDMPTFNEVVSTKLIQAEVQLNENAQLRWHIQPISITQLLDITQEEVKQLIQTMNDKNEFVKKHKDYTEDAFGTAVEKFIKAIERENT